LNDFAKAAAPLQRLGTHLDMLETLEQLMLPRRDLFRLLAATYLSWPLSARAQQGGTKMFRLASLSGGSEDGTRERDACFYDGLANLGWFEGRNIVVDRRWAAGNISRLPSLATELLAFHPDVIMTSGTPAAQAMQRASRDVPIVFNMVSDPVASGIVVSLARPSGNITGVSNFFPAMIGKLLDLIRTVSGARRFAVLHDPNNPGKQLDVHVLEDIGRLSGLAIDPMPLHNAAEVDAVFAAMTRAPTSAIIVLVDSVTLSNKQRIIDGVNKLGIPAIYQERSFVEMGGLMSYALNYCAHFHRAAAYVDKVLKGEKPSALPVEQPSTFELIVNAKTANLLGLTLPPAILALADRVIE
jgi:putative ABC transport system substrate-binding protein